LSATAASAQTADRNAADAALVNRVKDAVIKELRESGAIDRSVDAGIGRYVERQRAEAAQRERREADTRAAALRPVSKGRDHIRGNPDATVTLVEYSDFECPFCKRFHPTVKRLVAESNGQLRWVYRHFPLDELHPAKARKEAVASECAAELGGNDAFWKFADRFYELTPSNNKTDVDTVLPQIAREIGLDKVRFASCLASTRHDRRVAEDVQDAVATGGRGTPWSIIVSKSGKTYPLSGAQPYAAVRQLVDLALEKK
jgi:protein-disulfide isomerase